MALNCIIDDSALVAGIRDHTKDNLKQWIHDGAINLFVPLYTLEQLNILRTKNGPTSNDARKALEWLDHITSWTESKQTGRVELQGPDDQYKTWQEVEKYLLPDTPLSSFATLDSMDELSVTMNDRLSIEDTNRSNQFGAAGGHTVGSIRDLNNSPVRPGSSGLDGTTDTRPNYSSSRSTMNIPQRVRPLLNFVVWRTHHQDITVQGTAHYILLTDDTVTQKQAQKFGVRAKLLSQVRGIVARDRKRLSGSQGIIETPVVLEPVAAEPEQVITENGADDEEEEEEIVFNPTNRPLSSSHDTKQGPHVWDPDHFGRTQIPAAETTPAETVGGPPPKVRGHPRAANQTRGGRFTQSRGRGISNPPTEPSSNRSRAPVNHSRSGRPPRSPRGAPASMRGVPPSPRRFPTSPRARFATPTGRQARGQNATNPIDPDSYVRPPPLNGRGRGRGAYRRLWEPT